MRCSRFQKKPDHFVLLLSDRWLVEQFFRCCPFCEEGHDFAENLYQRPYPKDQNSDHCDYCHSQQCDVADFERSSIILMSFCPIGGSLSKCWSAIFPVFTSFLSDYSNSKSPKLKKYIFVNFLLSQLSYPELCH